MIQTKELKTLEDFENLKAGDMITCEFHRDMYIVDKKTRFATYTIVENKKRTNEIILQKKNNVYFNYDMFLNEGSTLKSAILITQI